MNGFMDGYTQWVSEDDEDVDGYVDGKGNNNDEGREEGRNEEAPRHDEEEVAGHGEEEADTGEDSDTQSPLTVLISIVRDPHVQELLLKKTTNARAAAREKLKLTQLEIDSSTPLYTGCGPEESRSKVTLDILQKKSKYKWNDASVEHHLKFFHNLLPKGNMFPSSLDEAKKVVCPLDLPHDRYHACINDCIIYRNEHIDKTICPVCKAARYKKGKKAPRKVVWYFLLIPRLKRYFADCKEAKLMRWHVERKKANARDASWRKQTVLTHPADACQW
jgi:hypothetical protein